MADTIEIPDCGLNKELELILGKDLAENITLGLYVNNATINDSTVIGDLTEASVNAYAANTLTMASWGAPAVASSQSVSAYAQQTFSMTDDSSGSITYYGVFAKMATTGTLLWVTKFAAAKTFATGDIKVTPTRKYAQTT